MTEAICFSCCYAITAICVTVGWCAWIGWTPVVRNYFYAEPDSDELPDWLSGRN